MFPPCKQQLYLLLLATVLLQCCLAQQDFSTAPIPDPFQIGDMYPRRSETDVCRPIQDYIDRGSARFNSQLVTNTNADVTFATSDSRIMSSRLQSRLNTLANSYTRRKITVLRAWTPFQNAALDDLSLHYEGRTISIRLQDGNDGDYSALLTAAIDSKFDWVFYENSNTVRLSVIPSSCDRNIDVVFIIDQSGSVGESNHDLAKQFISNVVSFFSISPTQTRVGIVTYSSNSRIEFDLKEYTNLGSLTSAIDDIPYRGGRTVTALALNDARMALDPSQNYGARPASEGIPRIAILITDGKSNTYSITSPANNLKNSGVQVYTIGVDNPDLAELRFISSDPDDEHVFLLNDYREAIAFVDFLSVTTCETAAIVGTCETTSTLVPQDSLQYYQAQCPSFTSSVLVELTDMSGASFLYCSTATTNPGPLTSNTVSDERTGVSRRQCQLSVPPGTETIHIGVLGQEVMNNVTLVVNNQILTQTQVTANVVEGDLYRLDLSTLLRSDASSLSWEYRIANGNVGNVFNIANGNVFRIRSTSLSSISFENQPQYNVVVIVERSGSTCTCSQLQIQLNVITNQVDFEVTPDDATVQEDAAIGRNVVTVTATNGAGSITYSITGGNTGNAFSIDSTSGVVEVASALDFETITSYTLTVRANVVDTSVNDTTSFTISVIDVNEDPFFVTSCASQGSCPYPINENEATDTWIGQIEADDPDLNTLPNGMLSFRISPVDVPFTINSNGDIRTSEILDYETATSHSFRVVVTDGSVSISTDVLVSVNDLNDNAPLISGENTVSIDENTQTGFVLTQYQASDADSGNNAIIQFSMTTSGGFLPFDIDSSEGSLTVTGDLDYEIVQEYNITVTAANPGTTQMNSIDTRIIVNNLNDNRPTFIDIPYSGSVIEHSDVGTSVVTVQATDADIEQPGVVRYSIVGGNFGTAFRVDAVTGMVTVANEIDRESVSMFDLRVRARDLGQSEQRRTITIPITVSDINDHSPEFNPAAYSAQVREDVSVNTEIFPVFAFDNDEVGNVNSEISYSITLGNVGSVFNIDSNTGIVSIGSGLDFETLSSYTLTITATDQGTPSLQGYAMATITVVNVNDVPPSVEGSVNISLSENTPTGVEVVDYDATDADQSTITFSFNSGNDEGKFSINSTSGRITLVVGLDFETTQHYNIEVGVSDGELETTSALVITVLDENEFSPVFNSPTMFEIDEELASGTLIGTVNAVDGDGSSPNNQVTYAFAQQSAITDYITLDTSSGEIRTNGILDRENLNQIFLPPLSRQTVSIVARDGGSPSQQSSLSITITLLDINDNAPLFGDASYGNSLLENLTPRQTVFQLSATDADLGTNADIRFSFTLTDNPGNSNPFQIDEVTGLLEMITSLDCEQQSSYNFSLTAVDLGSPRQTSSVSGQLTVLDENDNAPIFTMDQYNFDVLEDVQQDASIAQVMASDADKGSNGEVVYSIINQEAIANSFESGVDVIPSVMIDSSSGKIFLETEFNFEQQVEYNVTVVAKDRGIPRMTSSAQIVFNIQNADESAPSFPPLCEFSVPENAALNEVIAECLATDEDNIATSPSDVLVMYSIFSGNEDNMFAIDSSTGGISLLQALDRETIPSHSFMIQGQDISGRSTFQNVRIIVSDVNDNSPQFGSNSYSYDFTVSRIQSRTRSLITVSATDMDIDQNSAITYSITSVTREDLRTTLELTAEDGGSPASTNTVELVISFEEVCLLQDYSIDSSSGQVSASVLCSVSISPRALNITLGGSSTLSCQVLHNSPMNDQWIHNGSFITSLSMTNQNTEISYTLTDARLSDQGEYACKITTAAGSLQSASEFVSVQVPPMITVPPVNQAAKEGESVTFTCTAVGVPDPKIEWFFRDSTSVQQGSTLVIEKMDSTKTGTYTCAATNSNLGNSAVALATLTLYKSENVVELTLDEISSPSEDGTCHYINYNAITSIINDLTRQTTLITGVEGSNICEVSACMPTPCQNRGTCSLNLRSLGGYECSCADGYTGTNCELDVLECAEDPCQNNGNCTELEGSFQCDCTSGFSGHRCQYMDTCATSNPCTAGTELCVDNSVGETECVPQPTPATSLIIAGLNIKPGFLNDFIQSYLERMVASSTRRKRQLVFTTSCEPRFIEMSPEMFALVWLCAAADTPPTAEEVTSLNLCSILLSRPVSSCTPPGGEEMVPPTPQPLQNTSATIDIILVKPITGEPQDALLVVEELKNIGVIEAISRSTGSEVTTITAEVLGPRDPGDNPDNEPEGTSSVGAGAAIGSLLLLCVVIGVVVGGVVGVVKYREHQRRQGSKRERALERAQSLHSINVELGPPQKQLQSTSSTMELLDNCSSNIYSTTSGSQEDPLSPVTPRSTDEVFANVDHDIVEGDNDC